MLTGKKRGEPVQGLILASDEGIVPDRREDGFLAWIFQARVEVRFSLCPLFFATVFVDNLQQLLRYGDDRDSFPFQGGPQRFGNAPRILHARKDLPFTRPGSAGVFFESVEAD